MLLFVFPAEDQKALVAPPPPFLLLQWLCELTPIIYTYSLLQEDWISNQSGIKKQDYL